MASPARAATSVLAALSLAGGIAVAEDAAPTPGDAPATAADVRAALLAELPPIAFDSRGVKTLTIEGIVRPLDQHFVIDARGGDEYELTISAIDDGEPYMLGRDGTSLAYAPGARGTKRSSVSLFPGLLQFYLGLEDEGLQCAVALVGPQENEPGQAVIIDIDPASILREATEDLHVERGSGGRYRLTGASPRGSVMTVDVDPSATYPVRAMTITVADADEPSIEITKLTVNAEPGPRRIGIPTTAALGEHFDVEDLRGLPDARSAVGGLRAMLASVRARRRMAAADASRKPVEKARALLDRRERAALGRLARAAAE